LPLGKIPEKKRQSRKRKWRLPLYLIRREAEWFFLQEVGKAIPFPFILTAPAGPKRRRAAARESGAKETWMKRQGACRPVK